MKKTLCTALLLFLSIPLFAESLPGTSVSIEAGIPSFSGGLSDGFLTVGAKRMLWGDVFGLSAGAGYMSAFQDRGFVLPVTLVCTPLSTLVSPELFFGPAFSWNHYDAHTSHGRKSRVFDAGADACFEFGGGVVVRPESVPVVVGARVHCYTDFSGATQGLVSFSAGYCF